MPIDLPKKYIFQIRFSQHNYTWWGPVQLEGVETRHDRHWQHLLFGIGQVSRKFFRFSNRLKIFVPIYYIGPQKIDSNQRKMEYFKLNGT